MKKFLISLISSIIIISFYGYLYIFYPTIMNNFDKKIVDTYFNIRGDKKASDNVVIVDLDEKSLSELGQWPWQRVKVATILENLTSAGAGVIGLDIVFAEKDNSSPKNVASFLSQMGVDLGIDTKLEDMDYDALLGNTVANTPTILGYVFEMEEGKRKQEDIFINIPATYIESKITNDLLIQPKTALLNIQQIQDNGFSSAFFNIQPDSDGITRRAPLLMKYMDEIYPSLSFEMYRMYSKNDKVEIIHNHIGVEAIKVGENKIPTDRFGRLFINYKGGGKTFKYISASDIYFGTFEPKDIQGKIVLIGTSATGLLDVRATPFDSIMPGVEVHANIIESLINKEYITTLSWAEEADLSMIICVGLLSGLILAFSGPVVTFIVSLSFVGGVLGFTYHMFANEGLLLNTIFPLLTVLSVTFASLVISYFLEMKQKEMIKGKFASKVSPAVMEDILKNSDGDNILEGREKEVTIFFSDVRGFTSISEAMGSAKNLIKFLNEYMDPMVECILETNGTIDKFIGDAIMAYWNAPQDVPDHADQALKSTIKQLKILVPLNKRLVQEGKPTIDIGIGLNTGIATVGEMGSSGRSDYTVIGDPINLGSRLESLCKSYGARIIISEFTKNHLQGSYMIKELDMVRVKGKTEPVKIYEVLDYYTEYGHSEARIKEEIELFNKGVHLYRNGQFKEAIDVFEEIEKREDKCNLKTNHLYIERCEHYIQEPPIDFDGVFTHTTKG